MHVSLNQKQLEELFAEELALATTAKALELCEKAPGCLTPVIVELTRGLSCMHFRSAGNAALDMELKPPVPLLDLLPVQVRLRAARSALFAPATPDFTLLA